MLDNQTREQIIALINREVVPAVGCTEPMCVSLCVARATEVLGFRPEKITALLSANILKNAMGVGIPGTGMIGLPIAIALGALVGKSEYQLEVIKDLTPETLEEGKQYIANDHIDIQLKRGIRYAVRQKDMRQQQLLHTTIQTLCMWSATERLSSTTDSLQAQKKQTTTYVSTCDSSTTLPRRHPYRRLNSY